MLRIGNEKPFCKPSALGESHSCHTSESEMGGQGLGDMADGSPEERGLLMVSFVCLTW